MTVKLDVRKLCRNGDQIIYKLWNFMSWFNLIIKYDRHYRLTLGTNAKISVLSHYCWPRTRVTSFLCIKDIVNVMFVNFCLFNELCNHSLINWVRSSAYHVKNHVFLLLANWVNILVWTHAMRCIHLCTYLIWVQVNT